MAVVLPPGWSLVRESETVVQLRCPSGIVGNMRHRGEFTILGCTNDRQIVECLRVMLPAHGVPYPPTEQLALL